VETAIGDAMRRMDLGDADRFVVGLPAGMPVAYATVCLLVEAFAGFWSRRPEGQPALVALAEDMGKVLGMELRPRLSGRPLVVLDELKLAGHGQAAVSGRRRTRHHQIIGLFRLISKARRHERQRISVQS